MSNIEIVEDESPLMEQVKDQERRKEVLRKIRFNDRQQRKSLIRECGLDEKTAPRERSA